METLESIFFGKLLPGGSLLEISLRILIAFFSGAIIGLEREGQHQPAGIRTHALISGVASLVMVVSYLLPYTLSESTQTVPVFSTHGDPGRIAAQIISGIGFLGAGAILKMGSHIRGLTTAASIWGAAGIGLAYGAGFYGPATISLVLILLFLHCIAPLGKKLFPSLWARKIVFEFSIARDGKNPTEKELAAILLEVAKVVKHLSTSVKNTEEAKLVQFVFEVENKIPCNYEKIYNQIESLGNLAEFSVLYPDREL